MLSVDKLITLIELALDHENHSQKRAKFHQLLTQYHDSFISMQAVLRKRSTFRSKLGQAQMDELLKVHCEQQAKVVQECATFLTAFATELLQSAQLTVTPDTLERSIKELVSNYMTVDEACYIPPPLTGEDSQ